MEMETVDRIENVARGFAVVLVALLGVQTLCDDIEGQLGPFATFAALVCVGLSWHSRLVRGCLEQHPRVFVAIVATCVALMAAAFLAAVPMHAQPPSVSLD